MARIRTIKPEFWTDSFMVQLPAIARLIYIALWTAADDHGMIPDEPERLAMEVMPREDGLLFDDWFQFFEASGRIERLYAAGGTYYRIAKWADHQRVDKPGRSRIAREDSRKFAIPLAVRRSVAEKYGCTPGGEAHADCYYCGAAGGVHWHKLASGRPSGWVTFPGLELDHVHAEGDGGAASPGNIVLACRRCNRSKGKTDWIEFLCRSNDFAIPAVLANPRESSCTEQGTGNRERNRERNGTSIAQASPTPDGFDRFWAAYPNKQGKQAARKAWDKKKLEPRADEFIAHVQMMMRDCQKWRDGFIPEGSTYVNQGRWDDQPRAAPQQSNHPTSKAGQAIVNIEGFLNGLDNSGNRAGHSETNLLVLGSPAGQRADGGYDSGMGGGHHR